MFASVQDIQEKLRIIDANEMAVFNGE